MIGAGQLLTVNVVEAETPSIVALIIVFPGVKPMARPLELIIATAGSEEFQITCFTIGFEFSSDGFEFLPDKPLPLSREVLKAWLVKFCIAIAPLLKVTIAMNCSVDPTIIAGFIGSIAIATGKTMLIKCVFEPLNILK
jgi:hypothetical protein